MCARDLRVAAAAAVCLLAACAVPPRWRDLGERAVPFETAWNAVVETSGRHGFSANDRDTDRGRGVFCSRWRSTTQGFGESRRLRVRAELERGQVVEAQLAWRVRFCVERQAVPNMARSMNPRESDWEADGQETNLEDVIETQLRMRFGEADVVTRPASADQ